MNECDDNLTRQMNLITSSSSSISSADPSNLPSDNRPTICNVIDLNDNRFNFNHRQTNLNILVYGKINDLLKDFIITK